MPPSQLLTSDSSGDRHSNFLKNFNPINFFCFVILSLVSSNLLGQSAIANPTDESTPFVAQSSPSRATFLPNGIYLYGQSRHRDQLGQAYMVFEVNQGQMVGAFYMPHSSFDCFWGTPQGNGLALTVIDAYTQETHPYAIAFSPSVVAASTSGGASPSISLDGFYPIEAISQVDLEILQVCQSDLRQRPAVN